jgi:hypothetical protein
MRNTLSLAFIVVAALAVFSYAGGMLPAGAYTEEEVERLIETASTPEDHMKLAEYYDEQAMKMEKEASRHTAMAQAYEKRGKRTHLSVHCRALSAKYRESEGEYKALADEHRKMAKEARGK